MRRYAYFLLMAAVVITALSLAGCGGGGGGSTAPTPTSATTRQLQIGDRVVYSVTGAQGSSVTGTATMVVSAADVTPEIEGRVLKVTTSMDLNVSGQPVVFASSEYVVQAADGTAYDVGCSLSGTDVWITSYDNDPVKHPSPIGLNSTWSYTAHYGDSITITNTYQVTALEPVDGRMAYKIHCISDGNVQDSISDEWYVPDLGCFVRKTGRVQCEDGSVLSLVLNLQSKNF